MRKTYYVYFSLLCLLFLSCIISCTSLENIPSETNKTGDGKYDSHMSAEISQIVNQIEHSVVKLNVLAFYKTWHFEEGVSSSIDFKTLTKDYSIFNEMNTETVNGTAFYVFSNQHQAALISCAHVFDFPDTVKIYYDNDRKYLKSISVKKRQNIYESGNPDGNKIQIVATDTKKDIAILKKVIKDYESQPEPLNLLPGSTDKLDWGSRVYVLGYPMGNLMLTSGVVSIDRSINKRFISDALFNRGISGSPVFALLDGNDNYQLIGMASSASSQNLAYIEPKSNNEDLPVEISGGFGDVVIKKRQFINYGITYSVSIEEIYIFISNNEKSISKSGIDSQLILNRFKTQK